MFDQHYMIDKELLAKIVKTAEINQEDVILEIGAGTGNLTVLLAKKAKKVVSIEKDEKHKEILKQKLKHIKNVDILFGDAFRVKFPLFTKCVSNLPYTICEPLMWKFIHEKFESLTLVVPRKFADKLIGDNESRLKLLCDAFYHVEYIQDIYPESFDPEPKVISALIKITQKEGNFFLREFFSQNDKKVKNALREILIRSGLTKKEANEQVLQKIKPSIASKNIVTLSLSEIHSIIKAFTGK
jgi:16S rRNA (adenine1518-N6/adenine1519-N6)-dimethyltransferase